VDNFVDNYPLTAREASVDAPSNKMPNSKAEFKPFKIKGLNFTYRHSKIFYEKLFFALRHHYFVNKMAGAAR
jgi:hypothetical protein